MEFVRRPGFHLKAKPQLVGEVCQQLEQDGKLTPKDLVNASRAKNAPLHNEFEWRDGVAAEKYREVQAGYIIRSVAVKITEVPAEIKTMDLEITASEDSSIRFYHAIFEDGNGYENVETISGDDDKRRKLMQNCLKDIKNFKEKYYLLRSALPKLFQSMDEATGIK